MQFTQKEKISPFALDLGAAGAAAGAGAGGIGGGNHLSGASQSDHQKDSNSSGKCKVIEVVEEERQIAEGRKVIAAAAAAVDFSKKAREYSPLLLHCANRDGS